MRTMKFLALAACCAMTCVACVDENTSVSLNGVINPKSASCDSASGDKSYIGELAYDSGITSGYTGWMNLTNNMSTSSPWNSSGGSGGSGSTLDVKLPDLNSVYLQELVFKCVSIDGDVDACDGQSNYTTTLGNTRVEAGGTKNIGFTIVPADFGWGSFTSCVVSVYAKFKDNGGLIKSETSHLTLTITDIAELNLFKQVEDACQASGGTLEKTDNECAFWGQDSPSYSYECSTN